MGPIGSIIGGAAGIAGSIFGGILLCNHKNGTILFHRFLQQKQRGFAAHGHRNSGEWEKDFASERKNREIVGIDVGEICRVEISANHRADRYMRSRGSGFKYIICFKHRCVRTFNEAFRWRGAEKNCKFND